jgi:hypothetical protein
MRGRLGLGALLAAACLGAAGEVAAHCRTTTCPLPSGFVPTATSCSPRDFVASCASRDPPVKVLPLWWRNACVGYDLQQDASRQVPYDVAAKLVAAAFARWEAVDCGAGGRDHPSIEARDLGAVACDRVEYNSDHGNQNVIVFRDDHWPHDDAANTLGLTTVSFDVDTGEIYDADMEINATVKLAVGDDVPSDAYDLASILTHEAGHFLGLAHSGDPRATMFAAYQPGRTDKRVLTPDDASGICSVYAPDGARASDPSVSGGRVPQTRCDPTPRHGHSKECR